MLFVWEWADISYSDCIIQATHSDCMIETSSWNVIFHFCYFTLIFCSNGLITSKVYSLFILLFLIELKIKVALFLCSSVYREMKRYQNDFSSWCGECNREKMERQRSSIAATRSVIFI